ncbi:hypothetical protein HMPREF1055_00912 [Bacteroides fragilis CL07T00C01]|jgi:hypothetical protein|uniref:DUF1273 domain-containing protein n=1 Tax=Bacteroides fragilis CL07T12C05 TaxID=997883 RepID=A0A0E2APB1_BACFG|nr:SLOG family protein [Bacteroides fragilis]EIK40176.1 hypothetical protein HMPREF1055_00912 [Bacteroides fragilis CL07T00C01]EIY96123.1 hypothetical protein HMPREF1056_02011 [Bacteroides fragilis CL07T12C05]MCE9139281.1 SLOG family protein [Bacteroides fragilis]MCI7229383.1 SLOG family protein [Bacteroides fragilis]
MIDNTKSAAFTGHRTNRIGQIGILHVVAEIRRLYFLGYRDYYTGMAEGFDLLAGQAVVLLKKVHPDIRLIAVIPFRQQSSRYTESTRTLYNRLLQSADKVVVLSETYYNGCFHRRNDYLLNHADTLIACWDGQSHGGTYYTVNKARMTNRTIINIYK